jgi:hypothetical protein
MIDERRLWPAILEQAVIDLVNPDARSRLRYFTQLWFTSDNHDPGSFHWICDSLDIDPSWLRRRLFTIVDTGPVSSRPQFWCKKRIKRTNDFTIAPELTIAP